MNIILSDPKEGRAYSKKTEEAVFVGRKVGDTIQLDSIGLAGYKAVITGGSDKDGFPMKPSLDGQARKKLLMKKGIGVRHKRKGERRRKRVRGKVVAQDIHQLNLKVTEYGTQKLAEVLKKASGEEKKAEKKSAKDRALEQELLSKEASGKEGKKEGKAGGKEAAKEEKPADKKGREEAKEEKGAKPEQAPAEAKPEKPAEEKKEEPKEGAGGKEKPAEKEGKGKE